MVNTNVSDEITFREYFQLDSPLAAPRRAGAIVHAMKKKNNEWNRKNNTCNRA